MASNLIPIELSITRFYLKGNNSKRFLALSEEDLEKLSKRIYIEQDEIAETQSRILGGLSKLERYQKTLQYLTNPHIHLDLKTFDERAAYLIMSLDPNLVIFKEFLKLDLISIADISKVEDEDERNRQQEHPHRDRDCVIHSIVQNHQSPKTRPDGSRSARHASGRGHSCRRPFPRRRSHQPPQDRQYHPR